MPIPSGYSRSVVSGTLPGGEIWAIGLWANEAPSDQAATQSQADSFADDLTTKWSDSGSPATFNTAQMSATRLTVYSYLAAGGRATHVAESGLSLPGVNTQSSQPDQCCLVASLRTGMSGRRHRGRVYWPLTGSGLVQGQVADPLAQNHATWMRDLIQAWNGHLADERMVVLSQTAGTSAPITAITVDTRVDIQRRRANRQTITGSHTANLS